ncbi:MAG: family 78 glycoside hydrolase catalytic domain, partial [Oscillospiraceae bacterium]|nr:family 78 glycoside hydrolase catalytic domain [Oscillospiraceae bacterium]
RESHIKYSDLMMGEKWDLHAVKGDFGQCTVIESAKNILRLQCHEPVRVWESLEPVKIFRSPKGELIADFGQCLAGVVSVSLQCPDGREVVFDHSETLDGEGNFFRNILGRNKDQQDKLVCGKGVSEFCPLFTYHGFRYVRIEGVSEDEILSLRAVKIGTSIDELGHFECSHEGLNVFQRNIKNSIRANMVSVPTDCPQREKVGWTGDIQVFAPTGCFNYALSHFLRQWLEQMRLSQEENGSVPIVIPSYPEQTKMQIKTNCCNSSAAWSDACVLLPLCLFKASGDKSFLRDNLPMMEKWLSYIESASTDYIWSEGYHFGDWMIPSYENDIEGGTEVTAPVIAACQYAVTVEAYIQVLEALEEDGGKIAEAKKLLSNIRSAVRERFVDVEGRVEGNLQGLYVMALVSAVCSGELGKKTVEHLAGLIEANGGALDTGFVSTPHLLDVLYDRGYEELAWKLLFRKESPSWLYQVEKGASSIWENWNAVRPDGTITTSSYNHYSLGSVGSFIYRRIGGLCSKAPGWAEIDYAPQINCGLESAKCSFQSPWGLASCRL